MKTFNNILSVAVMVGALALALAVPKAEAQLGFDAYAAMDTVLLQQPKQFTVALYTTGVYSNGTPTDVFALQGVAAIDLSFCTNGALGVNGTMTATLLSSPDTTNWSALTNYSLATTTTQTYTNQIYGNASNLTATAVYNLNGVPTTPTAYSSGFATPYLLENPFTNTGAITCTPNVTQTVGVRVQDQARYWEVLWTAGGTLTNGVVQATIHSPYRFHY